MADNYSRDPDNLYDDSITHVIEIKIRRNGAMSVAGSINEDPAWLCKVLDCAKDAIRGHHAPRPRLLVPQYDTGLS